MLPRELTAPNNRTWLASGFQLVLGAGFFGMYQHAGALRALAHMGLHPHIREICGLSSGAITGALYGALGPEQMTQTLLDLSLLDFLDLSVSKLINEGALCAGKAIERKLALELGRFGCTHVEDVFGPKLRLAVFDGAAGRTVWRTEGPLAQTAAQSAALPVLFANQGVIDGGWVDHHGLTALVPRQRALCLRINTGLEPDAMQKLVRRPTPLFNVSEDAEHKTVALKPNATITGQSFLFDIDFRKQKLATIITESEEMLKWWLMQPEPCGSASI
jgi:predicted acylesterase/phospholipase RssA